MTDTDELIETLERRESHIYRDGRHYVPLWVSGAGFVTDERAALISALKENKRLLAWEQAHADAMSALRLQLRDARDFLTARVAELERAGSEAVSRATDWEMRAIRAEARALQTKDTTE